MIFDLDRDFAEALAAMPPEHARHRLLELLDESIRRDVHFIARRREDYPQALFQCAWNNGWWYDCPEADFHFQSATSRRVPSGPPIHVFMESWRLQKSRMVSRFTWLRARRPPFSKLESTDVVRITGHSRRVVALAYSPDGRRVAGAACDDTIRFWNSDTGEAAACIAAGATARRLVFSRRGDLVAAPLCDDTVRIWNADSYVSVAVLDSTHPEHRGFVIPDDSRGVAFAEGGTRIYTARRLREIATGNTLLMFRPEFGKGCPVALEYSERTNRLVVLSTTGELCVLNAETGAIESVRRIDVSGTVLGCHMCCRTGLLAVVHLNLRGNSRELRCIRLFRIDGEGIALRFQYDRAEPTVVCLSPDGERLAAGDADGTIRVWCTQTGRLVTQFAAHERGVSALAFSPDGTKIAGGSDDGTIQIRSVAASTEASGLRDHDRVISDIRLGVEGTRIATASQDGTLRIWNATDGRETSVWSIGRVANEIVWSPGGDRLAAVSEFEIRILDAGTGECVRVIRTGFSVGRSWFSENASKITSVSRARKGDDETTATWDLSTGDCLMTITETSDGVGQRARADGDGYPRRAATLGPDTVVADLTASASDSDANVPDSVAWWPGAIRHIRAYPDDLTWAGASGRHLCIFSLET